MFTFPSSRGNGGVGGGGGGGIGGGAGGATAVMVDGSQDCRFVSRAFSSSMASDQFDDEMLDEVSGDAGVFRSTPIAPIAFASGASHSRVGGGGGDSMVFVSGFSVSGREDTAQSQCVRRVEFSSIAEEFPLSDTGTSNIMQFQPSFKAPIFQQQQHQHQQYSHSSTACTIHGSSGGDTTTYRPQFVSTADRETPPLTSIAEMTQLDEQTILNRSVTIKKESAAEDDRHSPFGPILVQEPQPYQYNATKSEVDDLEQLKWDSQEQVFQRYFELKQREPQWGKLEIRDERIFFHPGKRREAIMTEKKFHDATYKEGIVEGDVAWYKTRRAQFTEMLREFTREETKHKQELMLAHLEKQSQFCKFPILSNRFLLTRLLGKGGNGEVWDVVDYADKKARWALKLSVSHKHARREHYTHSRLRHRHIARVGEAAYTMEYRQQLYTGFTVECVESDLQQVIEMHGHFDEHSSLKVLSQLLDALSYLHNEMTIAHYDLKPTNILVGSDECIKLTDFDLARNVHEPISSSVVGTLRYLPPECFRPNFGDCQGTAEKADIWMVGVVYCVMLWGKHPIIADKATHEEARATLARYNGTITFPQPVSDLSRWIIQGCMHPDPRCRPTAFQLLQALQNSHQARRC